VSPVGIVLAVIRFYEFLIFAYVILSWIVPTQRSGGLLTDLYRVLGTLCEPYVGLFRRILPVSLVGGSGLDFSPFIALLALQLLAFFIAGAL